MKYSTLTSDKEILKLINKVNNSIKSYANSELFGKDYQDVVDSVSNRVQNLLTFKSGKFEKVLELKTSKAGIDYIPRTQESVDFIKDVIHRQTTAAAMQRQKDDTYVAGKNIAEQLSETKTLTQKLKSVEKDLRDPSKTSFDDSAIIRPVPKKASKDAKSEIKALNRQNAANELLARAQHQWSDSIGDAIDKLYEDQVANRDLIDALNSHEKWTGDLLEEVNLRAAGIVVEDIF